MLLEVQQLISRYGGAMTLVHKGTQTALRAFLQETRSKSRENAEVSATPLGESHRGLFVYIGPVFPAAAEGDTLVYQQRYFTIRRAEAVMVGDKAVYTWGICVERGAEAEWES